MKLGHLLRRSWQSVLACSAYRGCALHEHATTSRVWRRMIDGTSKGRSHRPSCLVYSCCLHAYGKNRNLNTPHLLPRNATDYTARIDYRGSFVSVVWRFLLWFFDLSSDLQSSFRSLCDLATSPLRIQRILPLSLSLVGYGRFLFGYKERVLTMTS